MAKNRIHRFRAPLIDVKRYAINNRVPSSVVMRRCAHAFNSAGGGLRRLLGYSMPDAPNGPLDAFGGSFIFRTGIGAERVRAIMMLGSPTNVASVQGEARLYIHNDAIGTGSPVVSAWVRKRAVVPGTVQSEHISIHTLNIPSASLVDDTLYWGAIQLRDYMRLHSCVVFEEADEADDSIEHYCNPAVFADDEPIINTEIQNVLESADSVWRKGGATLFQIGDRALAYSHTVSSTTYTNVMNNTSTTVTANTPGVVLDTLYRGSRIGSNVSTELGVHAVRSAGTSTLDIRVTDGTNNYDFTGITTTHSTAAITSQVASFPRLSARKWDIQARVSNAAEPWNLRSIGLWIYLP